jgi:hypothetical protein
VAEIKLDICVADYADKFYLLVNNIDTIKSKADTIDISSKAAGIEVNAGETEYSLLSPHQNAG